MFFNFKKNNLDSERIYTVHSQLISKKFMHLLHLLSDEDILLTFNERDTLYEYIENIIIFLERKKEETQNEENNSGC